MKRLALALALGLALCAGPAPIASAQAGATDPGAAGAANEAGDEMAAWAKQLEDASARLRAAHEQLGKLENAKGRGAARRYPRGSAKAEYLADLEAARSELDDARRALPDTIEAARRAGVPAGVLAAYEDEAEADAETAAATSDAETHDLIESTNVDVDANPADW